MTAVCTKMTHFLGWCTDLSQFVCVYVNDLTGLEKCGIWKKKYRDFVKGSWGVVA
jgi:hypothetical protein